MLSTGTQYWSAYGYNTYTLYNPVDVHWDVLSHIMSLYYLHIYQVLGLNGVGVHRIEGWMRSLSWWIASSKCFGHAYGMDLGSMGVSESMSLSMLGEHKWRVRVCLCLLWCSSYSHHYFCTIEIGKPNLGQFLIHLTKHILFEVGIFLSDRF